MCDDMGIDVPAGRKIGRRCCLVLRTVSFATVCLRNREVRHDV